MIENRIADGFCMLKSFLFIYLLIFFCILRPMQYLKLLLRNFKFLKDKGTELHLFSSCLRAES